MNGSRCTVRLASVASIAFGVGCLSQSYEVSRAELSRLARLPPEQRGERVQVVQQTLFGDDVTDAERETLAPYLREPPQGPMFAPCEPGECLRLQPRRRHLPRHQRADSTPDDEPSAGAALVVAGVVAAVAATAAVTLAVTEGARYDGWVATSPYRPLLLIHESGRRDWVELDELEPRDLHGVQRGVLPELWTDLDRLGRRPLDRRGLSYQLELGSAEVGSSLDPSAWGYAGRVALGYMPSQRFGFAAGLAAGTLYLPAGATDVDEGELAFEWRWFVQSELWPISLGRWHMGPYVEAGYGWSLRDDALGSSSADGPIAGAGFSLQLDWTTRLALTLRAGATYLPTLEAGYGDAAKGSRISPAVTLGISIY